MSRMRVNLGRARLAGEDGIRLPSMVPVLQSFASEGIDPQQIEQKIRDEFGKPDIRGRIRPGMRIAIGVGSRGIDELARIVQSVVRELKALGAQPFIVPAMGSHGGASAEGQAELLAGYGIRERLLGVPIRSSMDTIRLGEVADGVEVYFDRLAYEQADGIVAVARIKPHTDFKASIESGILKMLGIGFGKHKGAAHLHRFGMERFGTLLPEVGKLVIERTPFLFGIGIVEDASHRTAHIEAVPGNCLPSREEELLVMAKRLMPRIWLDDIDVLVVDEIGKNISGCGMDPNVIGRSGAMRRFGDGPAVRRIVVRGLTEDTKGNAVGIGLADFTTRRVAERIDYAAMYTNVITAMDVSGGKLPLVMTDDRTALFAAVSTIGMRAPHEARIVRIRHTLELRHIHVSENMMAEAEAHPMMEPAGEPAAWRFDARGHLAD
ncbi:hypothetical protein ACFFNY_08525 [Paenibacillus hodogayensis]|uniref:LarA-like N-terminal domain-containing protein n=1 Tax=Paenibacillus hodogayensis TaxID=279208 RepID=A0ABV5VTI3_9BACL